MDIDTKMTLKEINYHNDAVDRGELDEELINLEHHELVDDEETLFVEAKIINPSFDQDSMYAYVPLDDAYNLEAELDIVDYDSYHSFTNEFGINSWCEYSQKSLIKCIGDIEFETKKEAVTAIKKLHKEAKEAHPKADLEFNKSYGELLEVEKYNDEYGYKRTKYTIIDNGISINWDVY